MNRIVAVGGLFEDGAQADGNNHGITRTYTWTLDNAIVTSSTAKLMVADAANVAERTLIDFERGARRPYDRTRADIRKALEEGGVSFIDENGGGPGVRLKSRSAVTSQQGSEPSGSG